MRTGTHRGESQSGMGKPSESYSAPPVDEVEVAETSQASAAAISDRLAVEHVEVLDDDATICNDLSDATLHGNKCSLMLD